MNPQSQQYVPDLTQVKKNIEHQNYIYNQRKLEEKHQRDRQQRLKEAEKFSILNHKAIQSLQKQRQKEARKRQEVRHLLQREYDDQMETHQKIKTEEKQLDRVYCETQKKMLERYEKNRLFDIGKMYHLDKKSTKGSGNANFGQLYGGGSGGESRSRSRLLSRSGGGKGINGAEKKLNTEPSVNMGRGGDRGLYPADSLDQYARNNHAEENHGRQGGFDHKGGAQIRMPSSNSNNDGNNLDMRLNLYHDDNNRNKASSLYHEEEHQRKYSNKGIQYPSGSIRQQQPGNGGGKQENSSTPMIYSQEKKSASFDYSAVNHGRNHQMVGDNDTSYSARGGKGQYRVNGNGGLEHQKSKQEQPQQQRTQGAIQNGHLPVNIEYSSYLKKQIERKHLEKERKKRAELERDKEFIEKEKQAYQQNLEDLRVRREKKKWDFSKALQKQIEWKYSHPEAQLVPPSNGNSRIRRQNQNGSNFQY